MSGSKLFASQGDFSSRVTDTIVNFDGMFVYAMPNGRVAYSLDLYDITQISKGPIHTAVHVDDDRLNINATRLGLVNWNGRVWDVFRNPSRQYRYGTPAERLTVRDIITEEGSNRPIYTDSFVNMLNNVYPSVSEAVSRIRASRGVESYALSRSVYIRENELGLLTVCFKNNDTLLWVGPDNSINFVEKTATNRYLSMCSKTMTRIVRELRDNVSL